MTTDNFNRYCEALLVRYNSRKTAAVTRHLKSLCDFLRDQGHTTVQTIFGGSVRKGTFVNGLSDVDVLLTVTDTSLATRPPKQVIAYVQATIQQRLPLNKVTAGRLAVTVAYADGTEIQLLPAIRRKSGVRIAEARSTTWSNVVQPEKFAEKLAQVNQAHSGRVILIVKLAKAIADCFISRPSRKISGYHLESLAIDAFKNYGGPVDSKSMLIHLFSHSMTAALSPIKDRTEQSRHVDEYLGPANSDPRKRTSTYFGQMRAEVSRCATKAQFDDMFCEED